MCALFSSFGQLLRKYFFFFRTQFLSKYSQSRACENVNIYGNVLGKLFTVLWPLARVSHAEHRANIQLQRKGKAGGGKLLHISNSNCHTYAHEQTRGWGGRCVSVSCLLACSHGLRTPNEGINQKYLENGADVADKICFGCT